MATAPATAVKGVLGEVALACSNLSRSVAFYTEGLGLSVLERGKGWAAVGAGGKGLVRLIERPQAVLPPPRSTGLYHFALHLPTRADLATFVSHAFAARLPIVGFGDHEVSEAIYLIDPDRHGIELYHDRPRHLWEGRVAELMTTRMVDLEGLLAEAADRERWQAPSATRMGHFHLKVSDLGAAIAFYQGLLGLEPMAVLGRSAAFLAWDGYHHHLGLNTWESGGGEPPPADSLALLGLALHLPEAAVGELEGRLQGLGQGGGGPELPGAGAPLLSFRDPSGNRWLIYDREARDGL